jgi:hypothetical protein
MRRLAWPNFHLRSGVEISRIGRFFYKVALDSFFNLI